MYTLQYAGKGLIFTHTHTQAHLWQTQKNIVLCEMTTNKSDLKDPAPVTNFELEIRPLWATKFAQKLIKNWNIFKKNFGPRNFPKTL